MESIELKIDGTSGDEQLERDFAELVLKKFNLFKKKQASYGSSNIGALGIRGIFVRLWDKLNRLKNLVWEGNPNPLTDENVEDTFGDIAIYALMAILVLEGKWPESDRRL